MTDSTAVPGTEAKDIVIGQAPMTKLPPGVEQALQRIENDRWHKEDAEALRAHMLAQERMIRTMAADIADMPDSGLFAGSRRIRKFTTDEIITHFLTQAESEVR